MTSNRTAWIRAYKLPVLQSLKAPSRSQQQTTWPTLLQTTLPRRLSTLPPRRREQASGHQQFQRQRNSSRSLPMRRKSSSLPVLDGSPVIVSVISTLSSASASRVFGELHHLFSLFHASTLNSTLAASRTPLSASVSPIWSPSSRPACTPPPPSLPSSHTGAVSRWARSTRAKGEILQLPTMFRVD